MQVRVCADQNENESIYLAIARLERNSHIEKTKVGKTSFDNQVHTRKHTISRVSSCFSIGGHIFK